MEIERIIAYQEGYKASEKAQSNPKLATNPYLQDTPEWRSWNYGWNSHDYIEDLKNANPNTTD